MNCQQVEKLLPLYVGRDLEENRARLVDVHLQSCATCATAAAEYRETRQLLQEFVPPEFTEDSFAEIRRNVWRQIETESDGPTLGGLISGWLQPRLVRASAIALLITVSALGIYFIANRRTEQPVANKASAVNRNTEHQTKDRESPRPRLASKGGSDIGGPEPKSRPQQRIHRKVVTDQLNSLAVNAPGNASNSTPPFTANTADSAAAFKNDSARTLRLEIQTKNPNIRIIWFAPRDSKQPSSNSKGI